MTTEQTITIHHEPPPKHVGKLTPIMAYWIGSRCYQLTHAGIVRIGWGTDYTAWYDPQIGEVERPRRFVVKDHRARFYVWDSVLSLCVADLIPTRAAAEEIAAIYEREYAQKGGGHE